MRSGVKNHARIVRESCKSGVRKSLDFIAERNLMHSSFHVLQTLNCVCAVLTCIMS